MLELKRFGQLEPIKFYDFIKVGKKRVLNRARWLYKCKCGREKALIKSQVEAKSARIKSCGQCGYSAHKARLTCIERNKENHPTKTHPYKSGFQKFNNPWRKSLEVRYAKYGPSLCGGSNKGKIFIPDYPNRRLGRGEQTGYFIKEEDLFTQFYERDGDQKLLEESNVRFGNAMCNG
tara:strand:+ start:740 stop:1270 length:531 start_codon:yes stop_codon:yes gene_type:complete